MCHKLSRHQGVQYSASDGWLWHFRTRYGLHDMKVRDETGSVDTAGAKLYHIKLHELLTFVTFGNSIH